MLERELLVRLPHDGEECTRLHQLCLDAARPPARSERVRRARREVAEVLDEVGARNRLGREHELEQAEGRLAELLRDRPARPELEDADRRRAPARATGPHDGVELGVAVRGETPERDSLRAGELEGETKDMSRAVCRVRPCCECVGGDAKRGLGDALLQLVEAEGPGGEPDLRRHEARCGTGALVEVTGEPKQLDAPHHLLADDDGDDQRALRLQPLGQPGQRLGAPFSSSSTSPAGSSSSGRSPPSSSTASAAEGPATARTTRSRRSASAIRARTTSAPVRSTAATTTARSTSPSLTPRAAARPASASASSAPGSSPARSLR